MKVKNMVHAGVSGKFIPDDKFNEILAKIEENNKLIKELQEEIV